RAQAGAAVLRWLALSAASGFAVDPQGAVLQALIGDAQRWLMYGEALASAAAAGDAHEHRRVAAAA
ncbi:MAG: hypothetical protein JWP22_4306, partial [Ramlibacter sp.]|nr:hypothetical protein [Ramlibacter sp.]